MATTRVELKPFLISLAAVCCVEAVIGGLAVKMPAGSLSLLGGARTVEAVLVLLVFSQQINGMATIGLSSGTLGDGLLRGLIWSAGFGVAVFVGFAILFFIGIDPFSLVGMRLPEEKSSLIYFILVGGFISPVAEEVFFRGVIFGYFRRWGFWPALIVSTAGFIAAHLYGNRLPITQAVGGVVFGIAYEKTGSLAAPITIHVLGNLAIFTLSILTSAR
ncbi:MAG: type II CAAX endopeptidase family protein [Thermodesulfobacteriota bacterium]|nr:type II CAAX endopeptidase family protein [Thermodesulfobacteriota bacterium]